MTLPVCIDVSVLADRRSFGARCSPSMARRLWVAPNSTSVVRRCESLVRAVAVPHRSNFPGHTRPRIATSTSRTSTMGSIRRRILPLAVRSRAVVEVEGRRAQRRPPLPAQVKPLPAVRHRRQAAQSNQRRPWSRARRLLPSLPPRPQARWRSTDSAEGLDIQDQLPVWRAPLVPSRMTTTLSVCSFYSTFQTCPTRSLAPSQHSLHAATEVSHIHISIRLHPLVNASPIIGISMLPINAHKCGGVGR
jgi:hypothetical protein